MQPASGGVPARRMPLQHLEERGIATEWRGLSLIACASAIRTGCGLERKPATAGTTPAQKHDRFTRHQVSPPLLVTIVLIVTKRSGAVSVFQCELRRCGHPYIYRNRQC